MVLVINHSKYLNQVHELQRVTLATSITGKQTIPNSNVLLIHLVSGYLNAKEIEPKNEFPDVIATGANPLNWVFSLK